MGMHAPPSDDKSAKGSTKTISRTLGSASAGACELMLFHPVDTVTKRLMTNKVPYRVPGQTLTNLNKIIFKDKANASVLRKAFSLFPGLGFAAGYKILQRTYKFGGQPFVNDLLNQHCSDWFKGTFGEKKGKALMAATSGSLIGIGEILLLPLDVLKIKAQTNPEAFGSNKGLGMMKLFWTEGRSLYAGAGWTAARNAPGSFALFGGAEAVYQGLFHLENPKKATFMQMFVASIAGSVSSIIVSAPLDTIKTRIQNQNFGTKVSGFHVLNDLRKNEGLSALFKGLTPKVLMVGPKLIFSFTLAQYLIVKIEKMLN